MAPSHVSSVKRAGAWKLFTRPFAKFCWMKCWKPFAHPTVQHHSTTFQQRSTKSNRCWSKCWSRLLGPLDSTSTRFKSGALDLFSCCHLMLRLTQQSSFFNSFFRSSVNFCGLRFRRFILISWQHLSISPRDCNCRFPVILEILDSWETQMWFLDNSLKEMNLFTSFQNISFNINRWNRVLVISK